MSDTPPTSGQPREFEERFASLPRWRRPRRLRRQLALALVTTAAVAVATFGAVNFVGARDLLVRGTEDQLVAVGATRADSVAAGEDRLIAEISVAASDRAIAGVLVDFDREFAALEERTLTPDQQAELVAYYTERVVQPLNDAGLGPLTADDLLPSTAAGRWLQYHYVIRPLVNRPLPTQATDPGTRRSTRRSRTRYGPSPMPGVVATSCSSTSRGPSCIRWTRATTSARAS